MLALADLRQVADVARERASCECGTRPEVRPCPDPALGLQPSFDLGCIGPYSFGNPRKLVRKRDRQREERVHAVLDELRRLDVHPFDSVRERAEQLLDSLAVAVRPNADDDSLRLRERRDRVPEPEVLGQ